MGIFFSNGGMYRSFISPSADLLQSQNAHSDKTNGLILSGPATKSIGLDLKSLLRN